MQRRGLVLAAHGSDAGGNAYTDALAARLGERSGFAAASAAYHQGVPTFAGVLDELGCDEVVVVPLMTSRGYYCETVLPRELARNRCYAEVRLTCLAPVGVQVGITDLLKDRVLRLIAAHDLATPFVALVGHGTPRQKTSREATVAQAAALDRAAGWSAGAFFLEEKPGVSEVVAVAEGRDLIVLPFLIGGGLHVARDLGRGLGFGQGAEHACVVRTVGESRVVLDRPIGRDPAVEELIAATLATVGPAA